MNRYTPKDPCPRCGYDLGGSHYHCANCGEASGMYGHYAGAGFTCKKKLALPLVHELSAANVLAKLRGSRDEALLAFESIRSEVEAENPEVVKMLDAWTSACATGHARAMAERAGLFVYSLLKSQAEADKLGRELHGRI